MRFSSCPGAVVVRAGDVMEAIAYYLDPKNEIKTSDGLENDLAK